MGPAFAATRRVNPAGVTPVLTLDQLWQGLSRKEREPQLFIPMISGCEVLKEEGNKLTRKVKFGEMSMIEEVEWHDQTIVYFEMASGPRITNVVSHDENGELLLTFSFANGLPPPALDADGNPKPFEVLNKVLGGGIDSTLKTVREMVLDGRVV